MNGLRLISIATVVIGLGLVGKPSYADEYDQQAARRLVDEGVILPLDTLLASLRKRYPGRVLKVDLEKDHGRWVYEIELLDGAGNVWELEVDAAKGTLLERKRDD